jgi:hypothetical protein
MHFISFLILFISPALFAVKPFNVFFLIYFMGYFMVCFNNQQYQKFKATLIGYWSENFLTKSGSYATRLTHTFYKLYPGDIYLYLFNRLNIFNFFFFS